MMKREAGRILRWRSWCSRCSRPVSNYARRLSFCLPARHPVCQFSRGKGWGGGGWDERGDAWAARGKSVGHRRSQLKVTWPFDFVTCHQLPCLSLRWGVPAIHRCLPLPPVSPNASLLFLSPALAPTPSLCSFSFSSQSCRFRGEMRRCDVQKLRYNRQISLFFPPCIYLSLPVLFIALNEGKCHVIADFDGMLFV